MGKFRVKKIHIYIAAISVLLSGCHFQLSDTGPKTENQQIVSQIEEIEEQIRVLKENLIEKESVSAEKTTSPKTESTYFQKDYDTVVDYDSMILTMEERGINNLSEQAKRIIKEISLLDKSKFGYFWVELFDIDSFYQKAYMNNNISSKKQKHQGAEFYNRLTDSIYWEQLVSVIEKNSLATASKNANKEALSVNEIEIILKQMEAFSADIKKDYPEYDMEHLACQLSTLSLLYGPSNTTGTLASTNAYTIEWFLNSNGDYPVLQTSSGLNDHEFKHFFCEYCIDEAKSNCYVVPSGINYGNYDALKFSFIEEATAEEYSASRNHNNPVTYFDKIEIVNNLRFILSMQDDYEEDGFFKYSILRNPLALTQQFAVMDDQIYFFPNNLKMLAAYNACLSGTDTEFTKKLSSLSGYEDFKDNVEKKKEVYSSLLNYAQIELSRLFFTNLIIMNEEKVDMTLEYNFYLMRLFEKRSQLAYEAISSSTGVLISSAKFEGFHGKREMMMLRYLSDKYQIELKSLKELFDEYALSDGVTFPSFVDSRRINFYSNLSMKEYDSGEFTKLFNFNLQYYIQYSSK